MDPEIETGGCIDGPIAGSVRGVLSAIMRANVFEALLMGVPFGPRMEHDACKQKAAGWQVPERAPFTLTNAPYAIQVFDRRQHEGTGRQRAR